MWRVGEFHDSLSEHVRAAAEAGRAFMAARCPQLAAEAFGEAAALSDRVLKVLDLMQGLRIEAAPGELLAMMVELHGRQKEANARSSGLCWLLVSRMSGDDGQEKALQRAARSFAAAGEHYGASLCAVRGARALRGPLGSLAGAHSTSARRLVTWLALLCCEPVTELQCQRL